MTTSTPCTERVLSDSGAVQRAARNLILKRHNSPRFKRQMRQMGYVEHHDQMQAIMRGEITMDADGTPVFTHHTALPAPMIRTTIDDVVREAEDPSRLYRSGRITAMPQEAPEPVAPEAVGPTLAEAEPDTLGYAAAARALGLKDPRTVAAYARNGILVDATTGDGEAVTTESVAAYGARRAVARAEADTRRAQSRAATRDRKMRDTPSLTPIPTELLSYEDAGAMLGIKPHSVANRVSDGKLTPAPGRTVTRESVQAYATRRVAPRLFVDPPQAAPVSEDREARDALFAFVEAFSGTTVEAGRNGELQVRLPPRAAAGLFAAWTHAVSVLGLGGGA